MLHVARYTRTASMWRSTILEHEKKIKKNKNKNIKCINSHQQKQLAREYPLNIVQMATMQKKYKPTKKCVLFNSNKIADIGN